jgi:hypothetical protein
MNWSSRTISLSDVSLQTRAFLVKTNPGGMASNFNYDQLVMQADVLLKMVRYLLRRFRRSNDPGGVQAVPPCFVGFNFLNECRPATGVYELIPDTIERQAFSFSRPCFEENLAGNAFLRSRQFLYNGTSCSSFNLELRAAPVSPKAACFALSHIVISDLWPYIPAGLRRSVSKRRHKLFRFFKALRMGREIMSAMGD